VRRILSQINMRRPALTEHCRMKTIPIRQAAPAQPAAALAPVYRPAWRLGWLLAAPHRLAFASAALLLGAIACWWALALLARAQGWPLPWALPPALAHGLMMGMGFIPLFFTGFLFTAGPKWLGLPAVEAESILPIVLPTLAGWGLFALGVHASRPELGVVDASLGLGAVATGWSVALWKFQHLVQISKAPDRTHARVICAAAWFGAAVLWICTFAIATSNFTLARAAMLAGLWGFVGVVYAAVAHRMIPFFTASALPVLDAWRPMWLLWLFVGVFAGEAAGVFAETMWWPLPAAVRALQSAAELAAGAALLALAVRWGLVQSLRIRLLAMLHLGFVWLGLALLMSGISHALMASSADASSLGLAPLHAYTMGFLGSTLVAMATRVSCGHSGRTLAADNFVWSLFWLLQLAIVARVLGAFAASFGTTAVDALVLAGAFAWAAGCAAWALRYGRWYGLPRADGRPG
jgi:uncharacterized protein involved in response to NO